MNIFARKCKKTCRKTSAALGSESGSAASDSEDAAPAGAAGGGGGGAEEAPRKEYALAHLREAAKSKVHLHLGIVHILSEFQILESTKSEISYLVDDDALYSSEVLR